MTFREMMVDDLEQVTAIENKLFSDPWTKEGFFTFLTKDNTMFFVIEEKEKILAYCSMQTVLDEDSECGSKPRQTERGNWLFSCGQYA